MSDKLSVENLFPQQGSFSYFKTVQDENRWVGRKLSTIKVIKVDVINKFH